MTRFRAWVAEALSGDVVGEVHLSGQAQFISRFGGGTFTAGVSVAHLTRRDGDGPDWDAVERVVEWCTGGKYTLVLTQGQTTIGEWLIVRPLGATDSGVIRIDGHELDGYPAMRAIFKAYKGTDVEQFTIGRELLVDAFLGGQSSMNLTVPTPAPSGVLRDIDYADRSAYYSDLIDEVSQAEDGFEWRVVPTVVWASGSPQKVNRTIEFGHPTLARSSQVVIDHDGPGSRAGNAPRVQRSSDFARYARTVYGIGAGEGDKQPIVALSDTTHDGEGYLLRTRHVSFPSVSNVKTLTALTRAELEAAQSVDEPLRATLLIDKTASWPRVGDQVTLDVAPTYAVPQGVTGSARLGEVVLALESSRATTVEALASDAPRFPYRREVGQDLRDLFKGGRGASTGLKLGTSSITKGHGALELRDPAWGPGPKAMFGDLPGGKFGIGVDLGEDGFRAIDEVIREGITRDVELGGLIEDVDTASKARDDALGERIDDIETGTGNNDAWDERQDRDIARGRRRMSENEAGDTIRDQGIAKSGRRLDTKDKEVAGLQKRIQELERALAETQRGMAEAQRDLEDVRRGLSTERQRNTKNYDLVKDATQKGDVLEVWYEEAKRERERDRNGDKSVIDTLRGWYDELFEEGGVLQGLADTAWRNQHEVTQARGGKSTLGKRIDGVDATAQGAASAAATAQSTANAAGSAASAAQSTATAAQSTATGAASAAAAAQSSANQANDRITDARGPYGSLTSRLNAMDTATGNAQSTANSVQSEVTAARQGAASLNSRITTINNSISQTVSAINTLVTAINNLRSRVAALDGGPGGPIVIP